MVKLATLQAAMMVEWVIRAPGITRQLAQTDSLSFNKVTPEYCFNLCDIGLHLAKCRTPFLSTLTTGPEARRWEVP